MYRPVNLHRKQILFFDLDGTLTDSAPGILNSVTYALEKMGIPVEDRRALYRFIGPPLLDSFRDYYGMDSKRAEQAVAFYREYFSAGGLFENSVYEGIPSLLADLRAAGKTLAVATSKPEGMSVDILEHFEKENVSVLLGTQMVAKGLNLPNVTLVGVLGWWENVFVSIVTILVGAFGCMCLYDLALLFTACVTFGEGMVNAGKDENGHQMIFHASSVTRLEMRDKNDNLLPEDAPVYKNAQLVFIMESGRVNRRKVSRLTAGQYARVKAALEAEKGYRA